MYLIEKVAGPAVHFVAVYVDGPIGHSAKEAETLAQEITQAVIVARERDEQTNFVWENIQRGRLTPRAADVAPCGHTEDHMELMLEDGKFYCNVCGTQRR